jgi:hypothetical protein
VRRAGAGTAWFRLAHADPNPNLTVQSFEAAAKAATGIGRTGIRPLWRVPAGVICFTWIQVNVT